jgi:acyl-CoA synthetase (AMP-forming)/AMP-acid ligase II
MTEYFDQPEATAQAVVAGWLDTGDLGFIDRGELYISGRAKDVVIIRGANHQPQEFENCLEGISGVRTGCAVGLGFTPKGGTGEELLLLVETSGHASDDLSERIRRAVLDGTGVRPHTIQLLEPGTLPRTSSGKMRRSEALRRFLMGELSPPQPVNTVRLAGKLLESALAFARSRAGP